MSSLERHGHYERLPSARGSLRRAGDLQTTTRQLRTAGLEVLRGGDTALILLNRMPAGTVWRCTDSTWRGVASALPWLLNISGMTASLLKLTQEHPAFRTYGEAEASIIAQLQATGSPIHLGFPHPHRHLSDAGPSE